MCGIAGVLYRDPNHEPDACVLSQMGQAISHRGPDAEGIFRDRGIALVHRRLSIIDLDTGDQPIGNEDDSIQVVFNGEIYNYRQLKAYLQSKGHRFRTRSDTEVLVHLYEELGDRLVEKLRGMFAFALWDSRSGQLLLARDRVGLKPLYFYRDQEKLIFASELKGILAYPRLDLTLDAEALDAYLALGFVPGEQAIFRQVRKLPAGHVMLVDQQLPEKTLVRRYWQFPTASDSGRSVASWLESIEEKIFETVQAHLVADVPVGAFLSGGLDSSAMVATHAKLSADPIKTFSIGFNEQQFSELPYAQEVACRFSTEHFEQIVTPSCTEILDDLVHFYDEPFADSSAIPSLYLARLARQQVKVVISGDGGDEAFGGYKRYSHDLREARVRRWIPRDVRRWLLGPIGRWWPKADWLPRFMRLKTALTNLSFDGGRAYANTVAICRGPLRRRLLHDHVHSNGPHCPEDLIARLYGSKNDADPLAAMIRADIGVLLPDDFLTKVDRASMSCGLEVRPPLVDHELLELASQIPSALKVRYGETKWIFKQLFRDRLPANVIDRPKQGFEIPIDRWLRGPLRPIFESIVLDPTSPLGDWLNQAAIRQLYRNHLKRVGRHGDVLWSLLVFAKWAERYLRPRPIHPGNGNCQKKPSLVARAEA
jgi:asparagine synthase (glutamine-hydrolysing)